MSWLGVAVFAVSYVLISAPRVSRLGFDRPAGALLGAVACVALGVLRPERALGAINAPTLLLLFGVMGIGAFLDLGGFFTGLELRLARRARSAAGLMASIVWGAGFLSALITNDAVCVLGAPVVVRLVKRHRLPPLPFLLALATGANTGSAATLVGNPQNMLCAGLGGLSYREHLLYVGPLTVACLALNYGLLRIIFRRELATTPALTVNEPAPPFGGRDWITIAVVLSTVVAYTLGADLAWSATTGFVALLLLHRPDTQALWKRIDWSLLLFFSGLFVIVEGLMESGAPAWLFAHFPLWISGQGDAFGWLRVAALFLFGSNVVSNVPFILVVAPQMATLPRPTLAWEILAVTSTFAGNLTLVGSVANIIVAENAKELGGVDFWAYLRVGFPIAILTSLLAVAWLVALFPN